MFKPKITLEEIKQYYELENHTWKECLVYFNVSNSTFAKTLKYYNYKKPNDKHIENIKKSKLEKYGDENYNNEEQRKKTNLKRYGVDNQFKRNNDYSESKKLKYGSVNHWEKGQETRILHYGSLENSYKAQNETYKETCLEKYGVETTSKLDEVKEKIKEHTKETFLEKYGAESYWTIPNAKRSNGSKNSKANLDFKKLLDDNNISYTQEYLLENRWYDFKVDNTLIEINPTPTHNVNFSPYGTPIDKNYHKEKSELAFKHNFNCMQIWDWDNLDKIIFLLKDREKIGARKCILKEVSMAESKDFLNKYHLQNYVKDKVRIGLFYQDELVSLMTYGKPRYNKKYEYELLRYCSIKNVIGGANKMFKYFLDTYKPTSIVSYCDLSKFKGEVYDKLGFTLKVKNEPSLHWYNIKTKEHITNNLLIQRGYDQLFNANYGKGTSNEELMIKNGFVKVYDIGQATYVYQNSFKAL